jgi:flagellar assembly protein FliH
MNSSSSAAQPQPIAEAEPFPYTEVEGGTHAEPASAREKQQLALAAAQEQGRQLGQQQGRAEFEAALVQERRRIAATILAFAGERENYYGRVEAEVVQLALGIARKILHREAQLDPHALAGIVHITLERLDAGTQVHLHVHPREAAEWRHYLACQMEGNPIPDVHEDPALTPGECRIETSLGTTQVGFESQLKEIESGLLDLLSERPGKPAASAPARPAVSSRLEPR